MQRLKEENDAEKARLEEELKKASAALAAREAHEQALKAREGRGMYDQWLESGLTSQSGWSGRVEEAETSAGRVRAFNWHGRELFVVAPNAAAVEAAGHEEAKSEAAAGTRDPRWWPPPSCVGHAARFLKAQSQSNGRPRRLADARWVVHGQDAFGAMHLREKR